MRRGNEDHRREVPSPHLFCRDVWLFQVAVGAQPGFDRLFEDVLQRVRLDFCELAFQRGTLERFGKSALIRVLMATRAGGVAVVGVVDSAGSGFVAAGPVFVA